MRVAVTGARGFIGAHLVKSLIDQNHDVLSIDRRLSPYGTAIAADLNDHDLDLASLFEDVEVVFHLAAKPGVRTSWDEFDDYLADNLSALQRVLGAAEGKRVVFASSSSVYGDMLGPARENAELRPASPYGVTKLAGEHLCRLHGNTAILRYFTVYGPGQRPDMAFARFIDAARHGKPIEILGDGLQSRDFTYIDDAVDATIAAAHCGPGVYNVAGAHATVLQAVETLERVFGRPLRAEKAPPARGDVRSTFADTAHARTALGFTPTVSLEEGLRRQAVASW